ncbi:hypothetical protein BC829DRAFT_396719 [Chytridium lagenaria]|nr:hypothetical protein BC829DRAFT_396719 [Chytridium lagenaria]
MLTHKALIALAVAAASSIAWSPAMAANTTTTAPPSTSSDTSGTLDPATQGNCLVREIGVITYLILSGGSLELALVAL